MTVTYKGMTSDYPYRVAEINFNEETEEQIVEYMAYGCPDSDMQFLF